MALTSISRWATEDPNPTAKVAEKRRLEDIGTAAISAKLDPRMVDAVRAIRALEDGESIPPPGADDDDEAYLDDQDEEDEDVDDRESSRKRRRLDDGPQFADDDAATTAPSGLLSAETMEGLKYFAQLKQARTGAPHAPPKPPPPSGVGVLGDYGSDDDSD